MKSFDELEFTSYFHSLSLRNVWKLKYGVFEWYDTVRWCLTDRIVGSEFYPSINLLVETFCKKRHRFLHCCIDLLEQDSDESRYKLRTQEARNEKMFKTSNWENGSQFFIMSKSASRVSNIYHMLLQCQHGGMTFNVLLYITWGGQTAVIILILHNTFHWLFHCRVHLESFEEHFNRLQYLLSLQSIYDGV